MDLNPLTGRPLEAWQQLVIGPPETWNAFDHGPRRTVVDTRRGAVLPAWIVRLDIPVSPGAYVTVFQDTGQPGGSYNPDAQQLPDLVTTAPQLAGARWSWAALLAIALSFAILLTDPAHSRHYRRA